MRSPASYRLVMTTALALAVAIPTRASAAKRWTAAQVLFGYQNYPEEFVLAVEVLDRADADADAVAAVERGEQYVVNVCGVAAGCLRPQSQEVSTRSIGNVFDCWVRGSEELQFRRAVAGYTDRYNTALLRRLGR
jgi:hypothetical protein